MRVQRANTILYCSNWSSTVEFYRDVVGLRLSLDRGWFVEFELGPASFISVADADRATVPAGHGAGITLSWRVDDVAATRSRLAERGVDCSPVERRWGSDSSFFADPEGNRIEVWAPPS